MSVPNIHFKNFSVSNHLFYAFYPSQILPFPHNIFCLKSYTFTDAFSSRERQILLRYVDSLSGCIGAAERLIQTPVPLTYARHTSRFLTLFCASAPWFLVADLGLYVVPFVVMLTWSLFGILEIGMTIEEPFQRALKLELFADAVIKDFSDLIHVTECDGRGNPRLTSPAFEYKAPTRSKYPVHNTKPRNIFKSMRGKQKEEKGGVSDEKAR